MRKKIIYVIGSGRSGTTLLDILLGNQDGVFSGGELTRYALRHGVPTGFDGKPDRTAFWRSFTEDFATNLNFDHTESLINDFEYYNLRGGVPNRHRRAEYRRFWRSFFDTLFGRIDERIVVDSSKYPKRALQLAEALPGSEYELCYIYIKRDPIGVVKSFAKTDVYIPPKNWLSANIYYFLSNLACRWAVQKLRKKHSVIAIKYERLVSEPQQVLDELGEAVGVDFSDLKQKVRNGESLVVGDLFEGNSMRVKPQINLRRETTEHPNTFINTFTRIFNLPIYR